MIAIRRIGHVLRFSPIIARSACWRNAAFADAGPLSSPNEGMWASGARSVTRARHRNASCDSPGCRADGSWLCGLRTDLTNVALAGRVLAQRLEAFLPLAVGELLEYRPRLFAAAELLEVLSPLPEDLGVG